MAVLKLIAKVAVALVVVLALAIAGLAWRGQSIADRRWDIAVGARTPGLVGDLAEGARQAQIRGCTECHGPDLGGAVLAMTPVAEFVPPNLTRGQGGVTAGYTDADWERAIRHGVAPGGRALILMPSDDNTTMSEADFAHLLAYLKSVPAVDRQLQPTRFTRLGLALVGAGQLPLLSVARIDHAQPPAAPAVAASVEYGAYVARICAGCHGENYAGGPLPGAPPDMAVPANLTPAGAVSEWTLAQFASAVRTGVRPDGRQMRKQDMPWTAFAAMTDTEIEALYLYLRSLPRAERRP